MSDAFYAEDGDRLLSSELTRGPRDPRAQHAGPPAALSPARSSAASRPTAPVGCITVEILRPVPLAPLAATARPVRPPQRGVPRGLADRPGRRGDARERRLRVDPVELSPPPWEEAPPPAPGGDGADFFSTGVADVGYHTAMESRFIEGSFLGARAGGRLDAHARPLVAGEEPTPLQRVLVAARLGKRRERRARAPALPVRQHRPERAPEADAGRRNGCASTR